MTARELAPPDPEPDPARKAPAGAPIECAVCQASVAPDGPHAPFCSLRCRSIDLHGWLSGSYQPPGFIDDEDEHGE